MDIAFGITYRSVSVCLPSASRSVDRGDRIHPSRDGRRPHEFSFSADEAFLFSSLLVLLPEPLGLLDLRLWYIDPSRQSPVHTSNESNLAEPLLAGGLGSLLPTLGTTTFTKSYSSCVLLLFAHMMILAKYLAIFNLGA